MTCYPCNHNCNEGRNCPARSKSQEPVAWHHPDGLPDQCTTDKTYAEKEPAWTPMYYKHEWVGLTDEEIRDLWSWSMTREAELIATTQQHAFARAIEAKLKEKNT